MEPSSVTIRLTLDELALLLDGLDALEYWEAGFSLPRDNGEVFIPGDVLGGGDRYWRPDTPPTDAEREAIEQVRRCRRLVDTLRSLTSSA